MVTHTYLQSRLSFQKIFPNTQIQDIWWIFDVIEHSNEIVNVGDHLYAGGALSKLCQLPFCRTLIDISPGCHLFFLSFSTSFCSKLPRISQIREKWSVLTTVFEKGGRKRKSGFAALGKLEQISLGTVCAKSLNCWQSSWKYSNWLSELYIRSQRSKEAKPKHSKHVFKVHKNMNYLAALAAPLLVWKIFQYFLFYFF